MKTHQSKNQFLKNESGSAILIVLVGIMLIGTLIVLMYGYTSLRSRRLARVKESLRVSQMFEEAARVVRTARDTSGTPTGMNWPAPESSCASACTSLSGGTAPLMCFRHPSAPNKPYCFYGSQINVKDASIQKINLDLYEGLFDESKSTGLQALFDRIFDQHESTLEKWNRIAASLESMPQAHASPGIGTGSGVAVSQRNDSPGTAPIGCTAAAPGPGCITCGGPNPYGGGPVTCITLSACPASYSGCTAAGNATTVQAFSQTLFLLPSGYRR